MALELVALTISFCVKHLQLGGPTWEVGLGRRASTTACRSDANNNIPGPFLSLSALINNFANQDLSVTDLVALSGVIIYLRCLKSVKIYASQQKIIPHFNKS